jgi:hypothetical protein
MPEPPDPHLADPVPVLTEAWEPVCEPTEDLPIVEISLFPEIADAPPEPEA